MPDVAFLVLIPLLFIASIIAAEDSENKKIPTFLFSMFLLSIFWLLFAASAESRIVDSFSIKVKKVNNVDQLIFEYDGLKIINLNEEFKRSFGSDEYVTVNVEDGGWYRGVYFTTKTKFSYTIGTDIKNIIENYEKDNEHAYKIDRLEDIYKAPQTKVKEV